MRYTSRTILGNKLRMLESMIYQDIHPVDNWETRELLYVEPLKFEPIDPDWKPIKIGDHYWSTYNRTRMFRTQITIPESFSGKQPLLVLNLGGEGLVRINGEIVSGINSYIPGSYMQWDIRSRVYIPEKYKPGETLDVEVETTIHFGEYTHYANLANQDQLVEYTVKTAFLAWADQELERYYFDLRNAVEAMDTFANPLDTLQNSNAQIRDHTVNKIMQSLNSDSYLHKKLFKVVMDSASLLDLEFDCERLKVSLPAASRALHEGLEAIPHKATAMVKIIGQAHIDTAWLWPLKESVRKCGKTFSNTLSLMEKYPEYIFAFSQPQLFAYLEEFYPELFEKVQQRVQEGRIELVGNAWVEMDTNVPSGESLVRQLLYGRQYYLNKFGQDSKVFWMPDVFGYTWALPQIMKRSGVEYFFTSKLVNNDTNRFPHSLFMWQGVDGTQILSYLQRLNYNGQWRAETLSDLYSQFEQKDICETALMTIGFGDGGGGPTYQMLENAKRLKDFPGLPQSEFSTSESFFREAEKVQEELPVWNDEMYYEFHRGTYTSQANVKKNNRKGELLLRRTEMACAMASTLLGREYPAKAIGDVWKKLLTNQFHDILPGSSIRQVYTDCEEIYQRAFEDANAIYDQTIGALNAALGLKENQIAVWNFLGWKNSGSVKACLKGDFSGLTDAAGNEVKAVVEKSDGNTVFLFEAVDVPAMGVKIFTANAAVASDTGFTATVRLLENNWLRLTLDKNGNIASLFDKQAGREVFTGESPSNLLTIFEDIPHRESAWNIDLEYQNHYWTLEKAESVELVENSPVRAVVRVVRKFNLSTITQDIILGWDAHRIDFETHVEWQETQRMLKAAFYADILSPKATYEIQFGAIERPTHWNTSYDIARFEVCGHKWADLSEGLYGVSILNDCKYGYDIKDNCMRLTLLRSPVFPDAFGDKGSHDFIYSIYPHAGDWRLGDTVREAFRLNEPLRAETAVCGSGCLSAFSFAEIDCPNVIIDTIKGAEDGDGLILRFYESQGARGTVTVTLGFEAKDPMECNLMEVNEQTAALDGNRLSFYIKPYEIKTFRIRKA